MKGSSPVRVRGKYSTLESPLECPAPEIKKVHKKYSSMLSPLECLAPVLRKGGCNERERERERERARERERRSIDNQEVTEGR